MPRLLVLTGDDLRAVLPMPRAIEAMRRAFAELARGGCRLPLRTTLENPETDSTTLLMGAGIPDAHALGAKIVSVFPRNAERGLPNVLGLVLLLDWETGAATALIDGAALTAIRTGAASGLATDLLAPAEAHVLGVIGSGTQARTQLEAVCAVREIDRVAVYSRTRAHAERFAAEMRGREGVPEEIVVAESAGQAVEDADIVCTATSASSPVLRRNEVRRGTHLNAIGSFTPEMCELEPELLRGARVVVDQREAALAEAGEVIAAVRAGWATEADLVELGELVIGEASGRRAATELTVFKSVGLAVQDVVAGQAALEAALERGSGEEIEL